jgi:hypothetical protein
MSLGELREAAIIATIVDRVGQAGRFCGETLLQKSIFFLKELWQVPFEPKFHLYHYGPFSFDLRDALRSMEADDILRVKPHELGATFVVGDRYPMLRRQFPVTLNKYEDAIHFAVSQLSPLGVKDLEPLATALFITREHPHDPVESRAKDLHGAKPHVDMSAARESVKRIDEWIVAYSPTHRA